jgi:hypothetical protein
LQVCNKALKKAKSPSDVAQLSVPLRVHGFVAYSDIGL